jgi:hypothetical protein
MKETRSKEFTLVREKIKNKFWHSYMYKRYRFFLIRGSVLEGLLYC